jgi:hypothetical protein
MPSEMLAETAKRQYKPIPARSASFAMPMSTPAHPRRPIHCKQCLRIVRIVNAVHPAR